MTDTDIDTTAARIANVAAWFDGKCKMAAENVSAARQSLAYLAAAGASPEDMIIGAQRVVKVDAENRAYTLLALAFNHDHDNAVRNVEEEIMDMLMAGPDDAWSGRGNDARRVAYEGTITACRAVRRVIAPLKRDS